MASLTNVVIDEKNIYSFSKKSLTYCWNYWLLFDAEKFLASLKNVVIDVTEIYGFSKEFVVNAVKRFVALKNLLQLKEQRFFWLL